MKPHRRPHPVWHRILAGALAAFVVSSTLSIPLAASASPPPAGTSIGNQATASYVDSTGTTQTATSNLVQTTVTAVGSFTLDTVTTANFGGTYPTINTKTGAAGATVYAAHVLTNTGNGTDTFTINVTGVVTGQTFTVYQDAGNGLPTGSALCTASTTTCTTAPISVAGNGGVYKFVVAYSIPSTATTPTTPYGQANIVVTPTTTAIYPSVSSNYSEYDTDNTNLTTSAAFSTTKSISVPAVTAPSGGSWPSAIATGQRSSSASCSTTWPVTTTSSCVYTVFTLTFTNSGGAAGNYDFKDTLPAGYTYVTGSSVWSSDPGAALTESGAAGTGAQAGMSYNVTGSTITGAVTGVNPNVTETVSFVAMVNNTATLGTGSTTNTGYYSPSDTSPSTNATLASGASALATSATNSAAFTVTGSYAIALGASGNTYTTAKDTTAGTPNGTSADTTTVASGSPGTSIQFTQTVYNNGNATDTANLTVASNNFPTGTTFSFFASDGRTPLLDTNGDGTIDTGPIVAGGSASFVLQANIPSSATIGSGPFNATVLATSVGLPTDEDATSDVLTSVVARTAYVDITNTAAGTGVGSVGSGDLGQGPSPNATVTNSTPAGTVTSFNLFVKNNDSQANTYTLSASQLSTFPGTLPSGWTVTFIANGGSCATSTPITSTGSIAAGAQVEFQACVTPPSTQGAVTAQPIYFQAQSTSASSTGAIVQDALQDAVTVTPAGVPYLTTVTPNQTGQVGPGGSVVYAQVIANGGTTDCAGGYTIAVSLPAADVTAGWTYSVYLDNNNNGQIDAGDTLVTGTVASTLAAGTNQHILVKVFAPGGASAGSVDIATVSVTFANTSCNDSQDTATDTSTVVSGQIRVQKTQFVDTACGGNLGTQSASTVSVAPGNCITYQIVATNQGSVPVTNVSISDAIPSYTTFWTSQPTTQCTSSGVSPALSNLNFLSNGTTVSCGSSTNTIQPGGTVTLTFQVQVNH